MTKMNLYVDILPYNLYYSAFRISSTVHCSIKINDDTVQIFGQFEFSIACTVDAAHIL
jgi:hypothetical protein